MKKMIGIDLGTTNSVVAVIENGAPKVLTNAEGDYTTPSVVAFTKKNEVLVGKLAKRQAVSNPENTIYSVKRFIGRHFSEMQKELKNFPVKITKKPSGDSCVFQINGQEMTPEKISSLIISKLKKDAEDYLGQEVTEAVITVPAYFNDYQRQATKDAGRVAGLDVKRIINEPTAAALSYGVNKSKNSKIAVYDFGGGTFDVSILEIADQVVEVRSTNGDTKLGGDDFDQVILELLIAEFKQKEGVDLTSDKMALQRLKEAAEKAKIELSSTQETSINLPFITATDSGAKHLEYSLTRSKFDQLTEDLVKRSLGPCRTALADSKLSVNDIDEVILVGGSTRIPAIRKAVKDFFKKEPNHSVNPDQVVATGAAIQAGILSNEFKDILLLDVTPLSMGVETLGGVMTTLITKNTTIPTQKSETFSTAEDNQTVVSIHVLQGERQMAKDNKTLGRFDLRDIPAAPRGVPQIEVIFDIDANGIINVSAKDKATGRKQHIKIERSTLEEKEIEQMLKEAEVYEEQDRKKKDLIMIKNQLDQSIYQSEKLIKESADKITEEMKKKMEDALKEAKDVMVKEDADTETLKELDDKLKAELQTIGAHIYKKTSEESSEDKTPKGDNSSNEPIDVN